MKAEKAERKGRTVVKFLLKGGRGKGKGRAERCDRGKKRKNVVDGA